MTIMNSTRLTFILLSVLIGNIHCSAIVRRQDKDQIAPFAFARDNFGCDAFISSCGENGGCCDLHDECYKKHRCTVLSWFHLWGKCQKCNLEVMRCIVKLNPGKSSCCSANNCGIARP